MPSSFLPSPAQATILATKTLPDRGRVMVHLRENLHLQRVCWTRGSRPASSGTGPHPHHIHFRYITNRFTHYFLYFISTFKLNVSSQRDKTLKTGKMHMFLLYFPLGQQTQDKEENPEPVSTMETQRYVPVATKRDILIGF